MPKKSKIAAKLITSKCPYCGQEYHGNIGPTNLDKHVAKEHPDMYETWKQGQTEKTMPAQTEQEPVTQPAQPQEPVTQPAQPDITQPSEPTQTKEPVQSESEKQLFNNLQEWVLEKQKESKEEKVKTQLDGILKRVLSEATGEPQITRQTAQTDTKQQEPEDEMTKSLPSYPTYPQMTTSSDWLRQIMTALHKKYKLKLEFVEMECEKCELNNGTLPTAVDFSNDLQTYDSGITNKNNAAFIANVYGARLVRYLQQREQQSTNLQRASQGIRVPEFQQQQPTFQGIQPMQMQPTPMQVQPNQINPFIPQQQSDPFIQQQMQPNLMQQQDPQAFLQQQAQRYWQMQNAVMQQNPLQKDIDDLKNQLKERDKRELESKTNTATYYSQRCGELEAQMNTINMENIQRQQDLRIENIQKEKEITSQQVELKKADHDFELGKQKIEAEGKKVEQYAGAAQKGLTLLGEGIGRGMASASQPEQQPTPVPCPHCNKPLILPPGVPSGVCPHCNGEIAVDQQGGLHKITPPPTEEATFHVTTQLPQTESQPVVPPVVPEEKKEVTPPVVPTETQKEPPPEENPDFLGYCGGCNQPVFDQNIGKTEGGKVYCKGCCAA